MHRISLILPLSMIILGNSKCLASPHKSSKNPAAVSLIQLKHTATRFPPLSDQGFVVIAVEDCSFLVNGKEKNLQAGQHQTFPGSQSLSLSRSTEAETSLVVINVVSAFQSLTFEQTNLAGHQILADASDRNATLIVATAPLVLVDVVDQAAEDEPWRSGPQSRIELKKGGSAWLAPGFHRLRNAGSTTASFVSVEW